MSAATPTADRLLDAAERLFAEHGLVETSLRAITAEAGANLAAVHYHFGSKLGLVQAVFARRLQPINTERLARLDALEAEAGEGPVALRPLLEAFLAPPLRQGRAAARPLFRVVARAYAAPDPELRALLVAQFDQVAARFGPALAAALPGLPREELLWRLHFTIGALCHTVVNAALLEHISQGACRGDDPLVLERLVEFAEAGLRDARVPRGARGGEARAESEPPSREPSA